MKVNSTAENVIRGKFSKTLATLQGYVTETGNASLFHNYTPAEAYNKFRDVQKQFEEDITALIGDIEV